MSPLLKTFLLVIVALVTSGVAAVYYPWAENEAKSSTVGEPLFKDYEPTTVRRIKIERFDTKTGKLTTVVARRKGEQWLLPDKDNFVATNARHIAQVTNSLLQREVLDETSTQEADHSTFGVIDPALYETTANKSALGIKITLEDASKRPIANLIVGKPAEQNLNNQLQKRFVSVPGQPSVYMIEINPLALTTQFSAWIQPNMFQLSQQSDGKLLFEKASEESPDRLAYKLLFETNPATAPEPGKLPLAAIQQANEEGKLVDASLQDAAIQQVALMVRQMVSLSVSNVFANEDAVSRAILDTSKPATSEAFDSLKQRGFQFDSSKDGSVIFTGSRGQIGANFGSGLVISLYLGKPLADIDATADQPERYALLVASVDESLIELPAEPEDNDEDEPDEAEKKKKAYLLSVKDRDEALKSSRVSANEFNQQHAGWTYAVAEGAVTNLLPVLEFKDAPAD